MTLTEPNESNKNTPTQAVAIYRSPELAMVNAALKSGNIEIYKEAVALYKELQAMAALTAFNNALADAKADIKPIFKNRRVAFEANDKEKPSINYAYEDLAQIDHIVDPILSKYGLNTRYRVSSPINEPVMVTCILSHRDGHTEETTLTHGRDDDKSNKNSIQRLGSTLTYLQRYAKKAAIGLSASKDTDGNVAGAPPAPDPADLISTEQAAELRELLKMAHRSEKKFVEWCEIETGRLEDMPQTQFEFGRNKLKGIIREAEAKAATND